MYANTIFSAASLLALSTALPTINQILSLRAGGEVVSGGAATPSVNDQDGSAAVVDAYTLYSGDGSAGAGWPGKDRWVSFDAMFAANVPLMKQSCGWNNWGADNSDQEIADIRSAIETVAAETQVDHRFILAVVVQESKGCVRVPTTNNGVVNPGLMQDHNGSANCAGVNPCPADTITQMIREGTGGTPDGNGLAGTINQAQADTGASDARAFYAGARVYNSGSANYQDLNDGRGSTKCYATDVANRLTGWTLAATGCN